jgi:S1-C subfamily serine protease
VNEQEADQDTNDWNDDTYTDNQTVELTDLCGYQETRHAAPITKVSFGSQADAAGIRIGDVIVKV